MGLMKRLSFSKSKRLVKNEQFKAVLAQKRRFSNDLLTLYIAENGLESSRLGISVGKSLGSAVMRNRIKRLLREAFRQNQERIGADFDYLFMISPGMLRKLAKSENAKSVIMKLKFEEVKDSVLGLVKAAADKIS